MATKKKAAVAPVDVPGFFLEDDGNKVVARAKASLAKKWNLARAESLADAAQLAWFFVALGRTPEAREVVEYIAERAVFTGDQSAWSSASQAIALAARLARERDDEPRRAALIARFVEHPGLVVTSREALAKLVADADKDVRSAEVEPSPKHALQWFASGCARAAYFRETANAGLYEAGAIDVEARDRTIAEGLAGLRAFLAR